MRLRQIIFVVVVSLLFIRAARAQSPNGTISGTVFDPAGKVVAGAEVTVVNDATRVQNYTKTNSDGVYVLPNLPPGSYRLQVAKLGFKTLIKPDITLNVQDALAINFTLPIGAVSETVTVEGGAPLVNTGSGSVSTVIDQNLVENLPLKWAKLQHAVATDAGSRDCSVELQQPRSIQHRGPTDQREQFYGGRRLGEFRCVTVLWVGDVRDRLCSGVQCPRWNKQFGFRRSPARVSGRNFLVRAGIRALPRWPGNTDNAFRDQRFSWRTLRILSKQRAGRKRLVREPSWATQRSRTTQ